MAIKKGMKKTRTFKDKTSKLTSELRPFKESKGFKENWKENKIFREKLIVALFLVFVIIAVTILFRAPMTQPSGKAIASLALDKNEFNASESIKGTISLQLEPGDILPGTTQFDIFIATSTPKCQLKYLCPNGIQIDWHNYSQGECLTINPDPESTCCLIAGRNCGQVVLNSKFNAPFEWLPAGWQKLAKGVDESAISITDLTDEEGELLLTNALSLDSSQPIVEGNVSAAVRQLLTIANRQVKIKDLMPTNEKVNITPQNFSLQCFKVVSFGISSPSPVLCNSNISYTAQMYLYGQIQNANYSWEINDTNIGKLNSTTGNSATGKVVTFYAINPGRVTIKVTANTTIDGRTITATDSKEICIWQTQQEKEACERRAETNTVSLEKSGALKWSLAYVNETEGCAFEVIIKGSHPTGGGAGTVERNLHYWYSLNSGINGCKMPNNNTTDKYIVLSLPSPYNVSNYTIDLANDWLASFKGSARSEDDNITEIQLVSYGYAESQFVWGQTVYFDNVELRKYGATEITQCPSTKKCCTNETGLGNYYGDQFSCGNDKACYDSCTFSMTKTFTQLKASSTTPNKFNTTQGNCKVVVDGTELSLIDFCYSGQGEGVAGEGYTACIDTSNTSKLLSCRRWDNVYTINLSRAEFNNLKAPSQNGSYALKLRISYNHTMPYNCSEGCLNYGEESCKDICVIKEISVPFFVGIPGQVQCFDTDYDCTNANVIYSTNWSACINGMQTRTKILINCVYTGSENCPRFKNITETETQSCVSGCTEQDYSCSDWQPKLCSPGSTQTRNCELKSNICDPNDPTSFVPQKERSCDYSVIRDYVMSRYQEGALRNEVQKELEQVGWPNTEIKSILDSVYGVKEKPKISWLVWVIVLAVIIVIAISLVILKFAKPKAKKAKQIYPELVSYIHDAQAAGATKQEIVAKLQEAGWPRDAIEDAFKAA